MKTDDELKKKWHRYDYVISRENFIRDGRYRLCLSSKDMSGNTAETHTYNGGEIVFTVDASKPEIQTVHEPERSVVYGEKQKVSLSVFDTVGLSHAEAFVNGKLNRSVLHFRDLNHAELSFFIKKGEEQDIRICVTDLAGNTLDTLSPESRLRKRSAVRMPSADPCYV